MNRISVQDLKAHLSATVADAESGSTVIVTRHGQPVAMLVPAGSRHVHRGTAVGSGRIVPALTPGLTGKAQATLQADRGTR